MRYLLLLLLTGCATTIDLSRAPPTDWPALQVSIVKTTADVAMRHCRNGDLISVNACTVPMFTNKLCVIYLATDDPAVLAHEKMHCLGYDHPGESTMRDAWAKWQRMMGR